MSAAEFRHVLREMAEKLISFGIIGECERCGIFLSPEEVRMHEVYHRQNDIGDLPHPSDEMLMKLARAEWMRTGRIDAKDRMIALTSAGTVPDPQEMVARDIDVLQRTEVTRVRTEYVRTQYRPARLWKVVIGMTPLLAFWAVLLLIIVLSR